MGAVEREPRGEQAVARAASRRRSRQAACRRRPGQAGADPRADPAAPSVASERVRKRRRSRSVSRARRAWSGELGILELSSRACRGVRCSRSSGRDACRRAARARRASSWSSVGQVAAVGVARTGPARAAAARGRAGPGRACYRGPPSSGPACRITSWVAASPAAVPSTPSPLQRHVGRRSGSRAARPRGSRARAVA